MKEIVFGSFNEQGVKVLCSVLFAFSTACALSGCIEEYEADIAEEDSNLLVVEGTICSSRLNTFILMRTQAINSYATPRMVTEARVSVRGSDGSEYSTRANDGYYACQMGDLAPDVEYCLHIELDGEVYESEPQKPLRTERIAEVMGVRDTPQSNVDVLVTPEAPFEPDKVNYYSWTYDETWEVRPDYTTVVYYDVYLLAPVYKRGQFPERGWKSGKGTAIMVGTSQSYEGQHIQRLKLYDIFHGDKRLYYRYSGLIHQRAISKAEYEYELARRQASSEMGGLFTPLPSSLPSNIRCLTSKKHVIGYVGCSLNTGEYRFFFNPEDFAITIPQQGDARKWLDNPTSEDCLRMVYNGMFLCEWESPMNSPDGMLHTAWAHDYQLDVRCIGASVEEPDFWSLEENVSY